MHDFLLIMYDDAINKADADDDEKWSSYLACLRSSGRFEGGSSVGTGLMCRKDHPDRPSEPGMSGFIRVRANSLEHAKGFLSGNPTYEAGGTVEIRELPKD